MATICPPVVAKDDQILAWTIQQCWLTYVCAKEGEEREFPKVGDKFAVLRGKFQIGVFEVTGKTISSVYGSARVEIDCGGAIVVDKCYLSPTPFGNLLLYDASGRELVFPSITKKEKYYDPFERDEGRYKLVPLLTNEESSTPMAKSPPTNDNSAASDTTFPVFASPMTAALYYQSIVKEIFPEANYWQNLQISEETSVLGFSYESVLKEFLDRAFKEGRFIKAYKLSLTFDISPDLEKKALWQLIALEGAPKDQ